MPKKIWIPLLALGLLLGGGGYLLWSRAHAPKAPDILDAFSEARVVRGKITVAVSGSGSVESAQTVSLKAETAATISEVLVKAGDRVRAGDELVRFSGKDVSAQISQEEAALAQLLAQREQLVARIQAQDQAAAREETIVAPADGLLADVVVHPGDRVSPGTEVATLTLTGSSRLAAYVAERDAAKLSPGTPATVFLAGESGESVPGRVVSVDPFLDVVNGVPARKVTLQVAGTVQEGVKARVVFRPADGPEVSALQEGVFLAPERISLRAQTEGRVVRVDGRPGQVVARGQAVAAVRPVSAQDANLAAQLSQLDDRIAQSRQRIAQYRAQGEAPAPVKAPIDGKISQVFVVAGQAVVPGQDLLLLLDDQNLQVVIHVDELDVNKIKVGQTAEVTVQAVSQTPLKGDVLAIGDEGEVQNGVATFPVTVHVPAVSGLKIGMTAEAQILVGEKDDALLVPVEAVVRRRNAAYVYVPASAESGGQNASESGTSSSLPPGVALRPVEVGLVSMRQAEIVSGLAEGDVVLVPRPPSPQGTGGFRPSPGQGMAVPGMMPRGGQAPASGTPGGTWGGSRSGTFPNSGSRPSGGTLPTPTQPGGGGGR
ncbi:efflux RND transporter periplasmic adaptor subunit [Brockia lithotrophica]|uniref:efflux RND transporter periplasmic adaptor subunit n=1 Tax=Brockia lithotrophica TaxID=933949 RepID=UPI001475E457|nr:HlyD family efflux transporter periplasmic adaptor subunit [Brockia lithotrophica]